jgi:hypothetical protein
MRAVRWVNRRLLKVTQQTVRVLCAVIVLSICGWAQPQKTFASEAYKKLESLAGDWIGKDDQGGEVKTNFKLAVANTVVMETLDASGMEEMLTLYSVDGDGISLLHYCPTNNQPHLRAVPSSGDVKQLTFSFLSAGNLPSIAVGHEHKMVLDFEDKDHITESWTWRKNDKDMDMVYHLARKQ